MPTKSFLIDKGSLNTLLSAVLIEEIFAFDGNSYLELEFIFESREQELMFFSIWLDSIEFPLTTPIPVLFSFCVRILRKYSKSLTSRSF